MQIWMDRTCDGTSLETGGKQGCSHDQLRPPARGPYPNWVVLTFIKATSFDRWLVTSTIKRYSKQK